jgi:hypothetical protein
LGLRASLEASQGSDCDFPYRESTHVHFVSCLLYQVMAKGERHPSDGNFISATQPIGIHYIDSRLTVRTLNMYYPLKPEWLLFVAPGLALNFRIFPTQYRVIKNNCWIF